MESLLNNYNRKMPNVFTVNFLKNVMMVLCLHSPVLVNLGKYASKIDDYDDYDNLKKNVKKKHRKQHN